MPQRRNSSGWEPALRDSILTLVLCNLLVGKNAVLSQQHHFSGFLMVSGAKSVQVDSAGDLLARGILSVPVERVSSRLTTLLECSNSLAQNVVDCEGYVAGHGKGKTNLGLGIEGIGIVLQKTEIHRM